MGTKAEVVELHAMADLPAVAPERRARIDAIKEQMVDAERGHELASLRKAQRLTQAEVAKIMGVTQGRISQIERGTARLDTATMDAYLRAIGGELMLIATVGQRSVRLLPAWSLGQLVCAVLPDDDHRSVVACSDAGMQERAGHQALVLHPDRSPLRSSGIAPILTREHEAR
jgi:DNA-binding XRE family transcriptional regulator